MAAKVHESNCANNNSHGVGEGSCHRSSPSVPPKPRLLCRLSQCRRQLRSKPHFHTRLVSLAAGVFLRLNIRYLLVLLLLYISGLIVCVVPFSALLALTSRPGAVYRSHELFERLWPDMAADNSTAIQLSHVWKHKRRFKVQRPCTNSTYRQNYATVEESSSPSGYLIVEANGGLNQQRSAICNAVAVAGLLNAALVIPYFEFNSVWRDPSIFADIYDQDHFITTLEGYVKVVKELPDELMKIYDHNINNITTYHVHAWAPPKFYLEEVYPVLSEKRVIRIAPFANRLAMNVPPQIQLLRCMVNHKALKFSSPIRTLAEKLVNRMAEKSSKTGGKYVSVHLRFEEDMVAFSCCIYDGGNAEKYEMDSYRETGWRGKFRKKNRFNMPSINRVNGKCPLTPLEVGMMLRGMGFDNNTSIYLASGEIYQAERHLDPLLKMFPLSYSKKSLATSDELAPFKGYFSRLAALDYMVCLSSEVFVTTQGGNFPHFLMGHRRFLFDGHAKTINPDKRKLVVLLHDIGISWTAFKNQMEAMLTESDRKGVMVPEVKKLNRKTSIYAYPFPECGCLQSGDLSLKSTLTVNNPDSQIGF